MSLCYYRSYFCEKPPPPTLDEAQKKPIDVSKINDLIPVRRLVRQRQFPADATMYMAAAKPIR